MTAAPDTAALGRLGLARGAAGARSLWVRAAVAVAALAAMFILLGTAAFAARGALDVIGHESGRQVVATADLYLALSDADTQVATVLLLGRDAPVETGAALREYAALRGDIAEYLLEANRLAGAAQTQRDTVESIMGYYGEYEQLAAEALLLADLADYPAGQVPEDVLAAYRDAADLMQGWILPQAYNLTLENGTIVRESHDDAQDAIGFGLAAVAATGAAALLALGWLQLHLARAFRRLLNPSLLVATAVTALYLFTGLVVLDAERDALDEAKTDGFDTTMALKRAEAISNSLHADQVRTLLDPARASVYEQTFLDKAQQLLYVTGAGNLDDYRNGLGSATDQGLIAAGTGGAADGDAVIASYTALIDADADMRADTGAGAAERLRGVTGALAAYEGDLAHLVGNRLDTFDDAVGEGEDAIADFAFLLPAAMVSLFVLTFSGLAPRLREFR
ncbi:hypothetical protein ACFQS3_22400 [Glycomyces mayteni]|uniref:Secreted protein n=1 Tax=Glycomyces mayteni TaxID=543887 RepID=A0ABW2DC39_9ACTN|nr:hypothetical protein GCM10025732_36880 [Glycomyces mayteni]